MVKQLGPHKKQGNNPEGGRMEDLPKGVQEAAREIPAVIAQQKAETNDAYRQLEVKRLQNRVAELRQKLEDLVTMAAPECEKVWGGPRPKSSK